MPCVSHGGPQLGGQLDLVPGFGQAIQPWSGAARRFQGTCRARYVTVGCRVDGPGADAQLHALQLQDQFEPVQAQAVGHQIAFVEYFPGPWGVPPECLDSCEGGVCGHHEVHHPAFGTQLAGFFQQFLRFIEFAAFIEELAHHRPREPRRMRVSPCLAPAEFHGRGEVLVHAIQIEQGVGGKTRKTLSVHTTEGAGGEAVELCGPSLLFQGGTVVAVVDLLERGDVRCHGDDPWPEQVRLGEALAVQFIHVVDPVAVHVDAALNNEPFDA
ncbi:hypothetical protein BJQ90_03430 [Arthrobacter sp. SO3]|nr:hypothetical protein [Arthrobacter sp. SO3]